MTDGDSIDIDNDPLTHSVFSISSILYFEIHVPDLSDFVHTSRIDGAQPSEFLIVFLAR